jgi:hypothetical protein
MSADEAILTAAAILGPISWTVWLLQMLKVGPLDRRAHPSIVILGSTLLGCTAVILVVVNTAASHDVVDAPGYQFMYVVVGLSWLRLAHAAFPYLGISPRDDAVERGNLAAASVSAGALLAVTVCYAGANVGNGPGWWVVLFSAALATGTLLVLWASVALLTPVIEAVIVDRDRAAAIRLTAFLISSGVIAGRGVAGDWESAAATVRDFLVVAGPAVAAIVVLAIVLERFASAKAARPQAPILIWGLVPAVLYGAVAVVTLVSAAR